VLKRLALLTVLLLGVIAIAQAQDTNPQDPIYGIVTVNNSDVRVGPDYAYDIIGQLPLNASVIVVGRAGDFYRTWDGRQWLQIQYGDRLAWVYARLLRTGRAFNSIPPTGMILPRDRNGRVPEGFDLSMFICDRWVGGYSQSGNFMAGDRQMTVTFPVMPGAVVYTVIAISPTGFRTPFDSTEPTVTIDLDRLPYEAGVYTWRVAPYWTDSMDRRIRQQICLLRTGGSFEKPNTTPPTRTPIPSNTPRP
jgi:hypothetical protein